MLDDQGWRTRLRKGLCSLYPPANASSSLAGMQRIWERGALKARSARARPAPMSQFKKTAPPSSASAVPSHLGACGVQERIRLSSFATQLSFLASASERACPIPKGITCISFGRGGCQEKTRSRCPRGDQIHLNQDSGGRENGLYACT